MKAGDQMTAHEIFAEISSHQITGVMFHEQMADYYDFLGLPGYKRMHEFHYFAESTAMRSVHRYFINHFGKLINFAHPANPAAIPASWFNYGRFDVDPSTKRKAIKEGFSKWRDWEAATKKLYEGFYKSLCDLGEIAAAGKVRQLLDAVDQELKCVERMKLDLDSVDYDLSIIVPCQKAIHDEYAEKQRHIGIDIC